MRILFLTLFLFLGFSCQKAEKPQPKVDDTEISEETILLFGDWKLLSGRVYMENLETHEKIFYRHFDSVKTVSSLRYSGWLFDIERIVRDSTTWSFRRPKHGTIGEFWLNGDSLNPYGLNITKSNLTIVENSTGPTKLGGSSRPISAFIDDYNKVIVNFYIQETYESIDGINYKYFSELKFRKL